MFICKVSIIMMMIYRKLGSVGPIQQKIKLQSEIWVAVCFPLLGINPFQVDVPIL